MNACKPHNITRSHDSDTTRLTCRPSKNRAGIPGPGWIPGGIRWNSGFHLPGIPESSGIPGPECWSPVEFPVGGTQIPESGRILGPESGGIPVQPFWRPVEVQSPTVELQNPITFQSRHLMYRCSHLCLL